MASDVPPYSRDSLVAEVTSYYNFLTTIYLAPSAIKTPPPEGWSELTPEFLSPLAKNDNVQDLIRHLPFIRRDDTSPFATFHIYENTAAVDFTGALVRRFFGATNPSTAIVEPSRDILELPAHVLTLATPAQGRNGCYFFVDTERGVGIICDWQNGPRRTALSLDADREVDEWKSHATYTIPDFFAFLKKQFRDFNVIAINEREVEDATGPVHPPHEQIKEIYRRYGLFTQQYDKDTCLRAVTEVDE